MSRSRGDGRQLSPWEQYPYFELPKVTTFPGFGATAIVASADPRRVSVIFAATGTAAIWLLPGPTVSASNGIGLTAQTPWIGLTHADYGPIVQAEWWAAVSAAGCNLTVIETILAKWPGEE